MSGPNRAGDGIPRGRCGGDEGAVWLRSWLASGAPPSAAGRSQLPGGNLRTIEPASRARVTTRQPARADCRVAARAVKRSSAPASLPRATPPQPAKAGYRVAARVVKRSSVPASLPPAGAGCRLVARAVSRSSAPASFSCAFSTAAGQSRLPGGGPVREEVVCASELPVRHSPASGRSRLPVGVQPRVVVVRASELFIRRPLAVGRSRLPRGSQRSLDVIKYREEGCTMLVQLFSR